MTYTAPLILTSLLLTVAHAAAGGWISLIDNDLSQFEQRGGNAVYVVRDGALVGKTRPKTPNSFLCTKQRYRDFELTYEFKVDPKLNSGVQFRSNTKENGRVWGYQCEIDPSDRSWSAGIYEEAGRGWLAPLKDNPAAQKAFRQNEWNQVRILAIGDHLRTWINDRPAADLHDAKTAEGFIGFQVHSVGYPEEREIQWRNIRIREIPQQPGTSAESTGPQATTRGLLTPGADYSQAPETASQLIGASLTGLIMEKGGGAPTWDFADGIATVKHGHMITKQHYHDFRLHLEFAVNDRPGKNWQNNGNSGVYIQQRYEVQILNSFGRDQTYTDSDCAAIYKTKKPDHIVCKKAGEWQTYDIVFRAARWADQKKTQNARITVMHNGTIVHDDVELADKTGHGKPESPAPGPIRLQDHSNPVQFRNFWIEALQLD